MNRVSVFTCFITLQSLAIAAATALAISPQESNSNAGKVTRVTLYRGQALVTRAIGLSGAAGSREIVVTELPSNIVDGSLYAEAPDKMEVLRRTLAPTSRGGRATR